MIKFVSVEPAEPETGLPINLKQQLKQDYERYRATLTDPKTALHEAEEQDFEEMKQDPEKFNSDLK